MKMEWRFISAELAVNSRGRWTWWVSTSEHVSSFPSVHRCGILSLSGQAWVSGFSRTWQVDLKGPSNVSVVVNVAVLVALSVRMLEKLDQPQVK